MIFLQFIFKIALIFSFITQILSSYTCKTQADCTTIKRPTCNAASNECQGCAHNAHCAHLDGGGTCDVATGICRPNCDSNGKCEYRYASVCSGGICRECQYDNDCIPLAPFIKCYSGICGNCESDADCSSGRRCTSKKCALCRPEDNAGCSGSKRRCVEDETGINQCTACFFDKDCYTSSPWCSTWGSCSRYRCTDDSQCDLTNHWNRYCALDVGYCVNCYTDAQCGTDRICDHRYCRSECKEDDECRHTGYAKCNISNGRCIACDEDTQCSSKWADRVCNNGRCSICKDDDDCTNPVSGSKCYGGYYCSICQGNTECQKFGNANLCRSGSCIECDTDSDCHRFGLDKCSPFKQCIRCRDVSKCSIDNPVCNLLTFQCIGCTQDAQCQNFDAINRNRCNKATAQCTVCFDNECTTRTNPKCNPVIGCTSCDNDHTVCAQFSDTKACKPDGECGQCTMNSHCVPELFGKKNKCDTSSYECIACFASDCNTQEKPKCDIVEGCIGCSGDAAVCDQFTYAKVCLGNGKCVECDNDSHCQHARFGQKKKCNRATNMCIACYEADCTTRALAKCNPSVGCVKCDYNDNSVCQQFDDTKYCLASGACGICTKHAHCGGMICDQATSTCIRCTDAYCNTQSYPKCDLAIGCTGCNGDNSVCQQFTDDKICTSNGKCGQCDTNDDCKDPNRPACDQSTLKCIKCYTDNDCEDPKKAKCVNNECRICTEDKNCQHFEQQKICDAKAGLCKGCVTSKEHCFDAGNPPICDQATSKCSACSLHEDCQEISKSHYCDSTPYHIGIGNCIDDQTFTLNISQNATNPRIIHINFTESVRTVFPELIQLLNFSFSPPEAIQPKFEYELTPEGNTPQSIKSIIMKIPGGIYINQRNLILNFTNFLRIINEKGYPIINETHTIKLVEDTSISSTQQISSSIKGFSTAILTISFPLLIAGADATVIFQIIAVLQRFYYLLYFNVEYPSQLKDFLRTFETSRLTFLPNIFTPLVSQSQKWIMKSPNNFDENKVTGSFLDSAGSIMFVWFLTALAQAAAFLVIRFKKKPSPFFQKIKMGLKWSGWLRVWIFTYYELAFTSFLQLKVLNLEIFSNGITSMLGLFIAIANAIFPFWIFEKILSITQTCKYRQIKKFGALVEDYDLNDSFRKYFMGVLLLKRMIQCLVMVLLYQHPLWQISLVLLFELTMSFFYFAKQPHQKPHLNQYNSGIELFFFMIHFMILGMAYEDSRENTSMQTKLQMGNVIVGLCILCFFSITLLALKEAVAVLQSACAYYFYQKRAQTKILPISQGVQSQQQPRKNSKGTRPKKLFQNSDSKNGKKESLRQRDKSDRQSTAESVSQTSNYQYTGLPNHLVTQNSKVKKKEQQSKKDQQSKKEKKQTRDLPLIKEEADIKSARKEEKVELELEKNDIYDDDFIQNNSNLPKHLQMTQFNVGSSQQHSKRSGKQRKYKQNQQSLQEDQFKEKSRKDMYSLKD